MVISTLQSRTMPPVTRRYQEPGRGGGAEMRTLWRSDAVGEAAADGPIGWIELALFDIAPAPVLARLERFHYRVTGEPEVSSGVVVLRAVAATHVPANHAETQVHPRLPDPKAVFAPIGAGRDLADLI
jgi:hypothetical protein